MIISPHLVGHKVVQLFAPSRQVGRAYRAGGINRAGGLEAVSGQSGPAIRREEAGGTPTQTGRALASVPPPRTSPAMPGVAGQGGRLRTNSPRQAAREIEIYRFDHGH